jgi:hydroxymethylpyrimidine pyrophosphatase-like HAD family hydrolase
MIQVIFSDVDGCFVPEQYDPFGSVRSGDGLESLFDYYRMYAGPQIVLCTGRAWENTRGILVRAGFLSNMLRIWPDCPVLCEHGMRVVVSPITGTGASLFDLVEGYRKYRSAVQSVRTAADHIEARLPYLRHELEARIKRKVGRILVFKKQFCFAIDVPLIQGTSERVDPALWLQMVSAVIDDSLRDMLQQQLATITLSANAVDVSAPLGKADGVRYLLRRYGTSPSSAAYIGDSVSDLAGMQEVYFACCPSNAVPGVKAYVNSLGVRGYVSPFPSAEGEADIFRYLQESS